MAQYKTGTVSVTNGSATVTGSGTAFSANLTTGNLFTVEGDNVAYTIASAPTATSLTLTAPYGGTTGSGKTYGVTIDFTPDMGLPLMSIGDLNTAAIYNEAMKNIDNLNLDDLGTAAFLDAGINSGDVTIQTKGTWTPTLANSYGTTITEGVGATLTGTWKIIGDEAFVDFYINFDDSGSSPIAGDRFRIEGMPSGVAPSAEDGWFSAGSANLYGSVASGNNAFFDCAVSENFNDDGITLSCLQSFGTTNYSMTIGGRVSYKIR